MNRWLVLAFCVALFSGVAGDTHAADVRGSVLAAPFVVKLELRASAIQTGDRVQAVASATSVARAPVRDVALALRMDPIGVVVQGPSRRPLGTIRGGVTETRQWIVCGAVPGTYIVVAAAEWRGVTGNVLRTESTAELLRVTVGRRANCPR